jgi:hypothetical protein
MITEAYEKLSRVKALALYPIVLDLAAFLIGLAIIGFAGTSKFTFKFSLNPGLPSISDVIDQNMMANGLLISTNSASLPMAMVLAFIVFWVIGAFVQAGFIGLLYEVTFVGESISYSDFIMYGKKYWVRFLLLELIVMAFLIVGALVSIPFSIFGVLLFLVVFFVLRILYIYWEFTLVAEDCSVGEAFTRSRKNFRSRIPETTNVIISLLLLNLLFGFLVNSMWNPVIFLVAILAYGYLATGLQISLMMSLREITLSHRE